MRALVTGAAGFIGSHVVTALVEAGAEVRAFDLRQPESLPSGADFYSGDLLDEQALRRALAGCDAVFHLAAVYSFARSEAARMETVNVGGTRSMLRAVFGGGAGTGRGTGIRRVVHTSSCATCGPVAGRPATERDSPPDWELRVPYKRTKLAAERLALAAAAGGAEVVIVNPTTPVGPGDRRPTPTGKMVADVAGGRARAYLAGSALNIVAVQDVAAGHVRAFEAGRSGHKYLLGGENLPMREVFAAIARAAGRRAPGVAIPWAAAYAAARVADAAARPLGREPKLLSLDEVRLARLPMTFDDARARTELGYVSRPATRALADAALAAAAGADAQSA